MIYSKCVIFRYAWGMPIVKEILHRVLISILALFALSQAAANAGDSEYGEYLSAECVTCHQLSGAEDGIPPIIGWDEASFIAVLKSYKQKERENPAMQLVTSNLGEEEMTALAAYFAKLEPKEK
jgi:cytochrome c553